MSIFIVNDNGSAVPPGKIVVLESCDLTWFGIRQVILSTMGEHITLVRVTEVDTIAEALFLHCPDILLLSGIGRDIDMMALLRQMTMIAGYSRGVYIVAYVCKTLPHLADLLLAFGIDAVSETPEDIQDFASRLIPGKLTNQVSILTAQERVVALALLAGQSVSRAATLTGKNIRTVSAQKQAIVSKLKMVNAGELQVLGGGLMDGGVVT